MHFARLVKQASVDLVSQLICLLWQQKSAFSHVLNHHIITKHQCLFIKLHYYIELVITLYYGIMG